MTLTISHIGKHSAAFTRPHVKKTHAAAMHRPLSARLAFTVRRWRARLSSIAALMQTAGFATVMMIAITLMTYRLTSGLLLSHG